MMLWAVLAFLALQDDPVTRDVTVAGQAYTGDPIQIFADDLAKDGGNIVVRGTVDRKGYAGPLTVEVSTDAGLTWNKAAGQDSWSYSFRPVGNAGFRISTRVIKETPVALPKVTIENLAFSINGRPVTPEPSGEIPYTGRITVSGTLKGTAAKMTLGYEIDGTPTPIFQDQDVAGSKDFSVELPRFAGETKIVRIGAVQGTALLDYKSFVCVPAGHAASKKIQIRNARLEEMGNYVRFEAYNPAADGIPLYNVPIKVRGSNGAENSSTLPELPANEWTDVLVLLNECYGPIDLEISDSKFAAVVERPTPQVDVVPGIVTLRVGEIYFYVVRNPKATLDKLWGTGKLYLPNKIDGFDYAPFDRDVTIGTAANPLKVDKSGNVVSGAFHVDFGDGQIILRAGELDVYLKRITITPTGCRLLGHIESRWSMKPIPFATKEVKSISDFYTANSGVEISLLGGQITGKVARMDVDFSDRWSPAGLDPTFKGIYLAKENIAFTPGPLTQIAQVHSASIEKFSLATWGVNGTIHLAFESNRSGPFPVRVKHGTITLGGSRMGEIQATSAEIGMPAWLTQAGMPAWLPVNPNAPLYNTYGQIELVIPDPNISPITLKFGEVTVAIRSMKIDLSELRSLHGDSQDHSWQGLWINDAEVTYKGNKAKMPLHIDTEMNGEFVLAESTQTHAGLKFNVKATQVKFSGQGNVSTQSGDVIMELPAGLGLNKGRSIVLSGVSAQFASGKPEFTHPIPGEFIVRCPGFTGRFKDLILDLSSTDHKVGTKPADRGLHLPPGQASLFSYFGGGWTPCGAFTINGQGLSGSYSFKGVTYVPGGWKGLSMAVTSADAVVKNSDLVDIRMKGTVTLEAPLLPSAATVTLDSAVFDYTDQNPVFMASGTFARDTKVAMHGGLALLNPAKLSMKFGAKEGKLTIDQARIELPPALGKAAVALKNLEIAANGLVGTYSIGAGPVFSNLSGVAGTKLTPSAMSIQFSKGQLISAKVSGKLEFAVGSARFAGTIKDIPLQKNQENTQFGLMIDKLDTQGQPFSMGGLDYSISSVAVDLSNLTNLSGIKSGTSWKGLRIISGTLRVPLKIRTKSAASAAFDLKLATFEFGGAFNGSFALAPLAADLLTPKGFRLLLTKGKVEVTGGKLASSSIDGTVRWNNVDIGFKGLSLTGDGNLYATGVALPKIKVGAYEIHSKTATLDLSAAKSPQGLKADWMGLHLTDGALTLPFLNNQALSADHFTLDGDGWSGQASGKEGTATFAGFPLKMTASKVIFKASKVASGQVDGTITTRSALLPTVGIRLTLSDSGVSSGVGTTKQTVSYGLVATMTLSHVSILAEGKGGHVLLAGAFTSTLPNLKAEELSFSNLKITHAGHVTLADGWVALNKPKGASIAGFAIKVEKFGLGEGWFGFTGALTIGKTFAPVESKFDTLKIFLKPDGSFDKFTFSKIQVNFEMAVVGVKGEIAYVEDGKTKGFAGSVDLSLRKAGIKVEGEFFYGDNGTFDYVKVDVTARKNAGKPLGATGLALYGIKGGFAWNMSIKADDGSFTPSKGNWVFSAGVIIGSVKGKGFLLNGDMVLSLSNDGTISLRGDVYFLCPIQHRMDSRKIGAFVLTVGSGGVTGSAWMSFSAAGIIEIAGTLEFKISSGDCYVRIGSKTNPITSTLAGVLSVRSYVMCTDTAITVGASGSFDLPGLDLGIVRAWFNAGYSAELTLVTSGPPYVRVSFFYLPARYPQISGSFSIWGGGGAEIVTPDSLPNIPLASIGFSGSANFSGPNPLKVSGSIYFYVSTWFYSGGFNAGFSKEF